MSRLILRNGHVFDGISETAFLADVLLDGDRILEVGPGLEDLCFQLCRMRSGWSNPLRNSTRQVREA